MGPSRCVFVSQSPVHRALTATRFLHYPLDVGFVQLFRLRKICTIFPEVKNSDAQHQKNKFHTALGLKSLHARVQLRRTPRRMMKNNKSSFLRKGLRVDRSHLLTLTCPGEFHKCVAKQSYFQNECNSALGAIRPSCGEQADESHHATERPWGQNTCA